MSRQHTQDREERRRCKACGRLRPLHEFPLRNQRPIHICAPCRMLRGQTQREAEREQEIKRCFLALGREVRRGRGNSSYSEELFDRLRELCGGNLDVVVEKWGEFLSEALEKHPPSARLKALVTLFEVLRLANQAGTVSTAPPAKKRRHREKPPDFSTWTGEELRAGIRRYQESRET